MFMQPSEKVIKRGVFIITINFFLLFPRNFMRYEEYDYMPDRDVNYLYAHNVKLADFKKAVTWALSNDEGGADFIQTGQNQASVDVKLLNDGDNAYRPDLYGKIIHVNRTVMISGGSSYKLMNEEGRIVADREVKEELDRILSTLCIQVNNPQTVLNLSVLDTLDQRKMYEFYIRSIKLENFRRGLLTEKMAAFEVLFKEIQEWEKKDKVKQLMAIFNLLLVNFTIISHFC